ncbi:hypothetical protein N9N67_05760 [Bacteriovoracaceae bacterium]|nr:hypothetical protein [Bacteriovoracaceae bacterium]
MKKSKHLRVLIKREQKDVVNLTMPVASVKILDTIMPDSVIPQLEAKGLSIRKIIDRVKEENFAPQTLFEMEKEGKNYRVWIE